MQLRELEQKLIIAVLQNELNELNLLLETSQTISGFNINFLEDDQEGMGLLHIAAQKNHSAIVDRLLHVHGININLLSSQGELPINLAIKNLSRAAITTLLQDKRLDITMKDTRDIILYDFDQVLTRTRTINITGKNGPCIRLGRGETPFMCAGRLGLLDTMQALLNKSNNKIADSLSTTFLTALSMAADPSCNETEQDRVEHTAAINLLFKIGAGIGCVIWNNNLLSVLPKFDTTGMIIIGQIRNAKGCLTKINRHTPGFKQAITSAEECEQAIQQYLASRDKKPFNWNFSQLIAMCDAHNNLDVTIQNEIKEIKQLLLLPKPEDSLKNICLNWLNLKKNRQHIVQDSLKHLPETLRNQIKF